MLLYKIWANALVFWRDETMKKAMCLILSIAIFLLLCSCEYGDDANRENSQQPLPSETSDTEETVNSVGLDGTISGDCFDISIVDVKWTEV